MPELLTTILSHVDAPEPLFDELTLCRWSRTPWSQFPARQFFRPAENATTVWCPSCVDVHSEEVVLRRQPDGTFRHVIPCPECLYVEIAPEELRQWTIDFEALTGAVATSLSLSGRCAVLAAGRLWRLGRTKWSGALRDVLLARGLSWSEARKLVAAIGRATRPIVIVASREPLPEIWSGRIPPVIPLSRFATLQDGRLELEHEEITAAITEADTAAASRPTTFTVEQLKDVVRHQVRALSRSQLQDEAFAEAYRREGSYRRAAAMLTEQTGREVTKDQIAFAVNRLGGPAAVFRGEDSESIGRTTDSPRRTRGRKAAS